MSAVVISCGEAVADYLAVASATAGVVTAAGWGVIKLARIRAPIYRQLVWLYCLIGVSVVPALVLYGPKLTLTVLPAEGGHWEGSGQESFGGGRWGDDGFSRKSFRKFYGSGDGG
jgi:hypothetical protein